MGKRKEVKCWVVCKPDGEPLMSTVNSYRRSTKSALTDLVKPESVERVFKLGFRNRRATLVIEK